MEYKLIQCMFIAVFFSVVVAALRVIIWVFAVCGFRMWMAFVQTRP